MKIGLKEILIGSFMMLCSLEILAMGFALFPTFLEFWVKHTADVQKDIWWQILIADYFPNIVFFTIIILSGIVAFKGFKKIRGSK